MRNFICPRCKEEIIEDFELIHGHIRAKHFERILDEYTINELNKEINWIDNNA